MDQKYYVEGAANLPLIDFADLMASEQNLGITRLRTNVVMCKGHGSRPGGIVATDLQTMTTVII